MKYAVCTVEEIESGKAKRVEIGARRIAVVRIEDEFYAIGDTCSHANFSLSEGDVYVEDREIECWKHGSTFSLIDGKPQCFPATAPVPVYEVTVEEGKVWIEVAEGTR